MRTIPEIPGPATVARNLVNETKEFLRSPKLPFIVTGFIFVGSLTAAIAVDKENHIDVKVAMYATALCAALTLLYLLWKAEYCDDREVAVDQAQELELVAEEPEPAPVQITVA